MQNHVFGGFIRTENDFWGSHDENVRCVNLQLSADYWEPVKPNAICINYAQNVFNYNFIPESTT